MGESWTLGYTKTTQQADAVFQKDIIEISLAAKTREEAIVEAVEKWQKIKNITREDCFTVNNSNPFLYFKEPLEEK